MSKLTVVGLDIGGTHLRVGKVTNGEVLKSDTMSSDIFRSDDELAALEAIISPYMDDSVSAVSIGLPGSISLAGIPMKVPNIRKKDGSHAFEGKDVKGFLKRTFGTEVFINNDVNNLLLYDASLLPDVRGAVVGCYIGTGFGSALLMDGKMFLGRHGTAGEAGHIPFYQHGDLCGCGNRGCAEVYASGSALKRIMDEHYPLLTYEQVFAHIGEPPLSDWLDAVATVIATWANLVDPTAIIVGGGVTGQGFPRSALIEAVKRHTLAPYPRDDLNIIYSANDAFSGVKGATIFANGGINC